MLNGRSISEGILTVSWDGCGNSDISGMDGGSDNDINGMDGGSDSQRLLCSESCGISISTSLGLHIDLT